MTISKWLKLSTHSLALLVVIVLGSMTPVTAQGSEETELQPEVFCTSLVSMKDSVTTNIKTAQGDATANWRSQAERFSLMATQRTSDTRAIRSDISTARTQNLNAMKTLYGDQVAAVATYATSTATALSSYRSNVDAAQKRFESAVGDVLSLRQASRAGNVEAFRISVEDSLRAASVSCIEDTSDDTIQQTLRSRISASRATFTKSMQSDTTDSKLQKLFAKRDAAYNIAEQTLSNEISTAQLSLKTNLKQQ